MRGKDIMLLVRMFNIFYLHISIRILLHLPPNLNPMGNFGLFK